MNIFFVDNDPEIAARSLCNKHVIKMPTETCNMLLLAHKLKGQPIPLRENYQEIKLTHKNHPMSKWVRESKENYLWALSHFESLCKEYKLRYKRRHQMENYSYFLSHCYDLLSFEREGLTTLPRCFGNFEKILLFVSDTVEAYREYYHLAKIHFAKWPSFEKIPTWFRIYNSGNIGQFVDKSFVNGEYTKR